MIVDHGIAIPWSAFWALAVYALVLVGLPLVIVGTVVVLSTRRRALRVGAGRIGGLLIGALAGVLAAMTGHALLSPPLVAIGYLAGVLLVELSNGPRPTGPLRTASLQARSARQYLPRWVIPAALAAGMLVLLAPVAFAVLPRSADAFPWPSPTVSVPLALIAVLALIAGGLLLARVAALPRPAGGAGSDDRARANSARAVAGAVLAIQLLCLGAVSIAASDGLEFAASSAAGHVASRILVWLGLGLVAGGLVTWAALSWWRREPAAPGPQPTSAAT
jgi:uncharacterized integral membrane protein